MARPTGRHPRRRSVVKQDGVRDLGLPHCNGCDEVLMELRIPSLHHWEVGFSHVRKYPFAEPTFFCETCKKQYDLQHENYVLVPMKEDQTLREALTALLESFPEA